MPARERSLAHSAVAVAVALAVALSALVGAPASAEDPPTGDGQPERVTFTVIGGGQRLSTDGEIILQAYGFDGNSYHPVAQVHAGSGYPLDLTLPEGTYKFQFSTTSPMWHSGFYGGASTLEEATPVTVVDDPLELTVDLAPVARAAVGRVVDDEGDPVSGVRVSLRRGDGATELSTTTDGDGVFRMMVGPSTSGAFDLRFEPDPATGLAPEWYDDSAARSEGTPIALPNPGGEGVRLGDVALQAAGSVSGRVTAADGSPIGAVVVRALAADGTVLASTATLSGGHYDLGGLKPGTVRVQLQDPEGDYRGEFYDDASTLASAAPVPVTAADETTGVDAVLARSTASPAGAAVTGRAVDGSGAPVRGIDVTAYGQDADGGWVALDTARTGRFGTYLLDDVESLTDPAEESRIKLRFTDPRPRGTGLTYLETWRGGPTLNRAAVITVPAAELVPVPETRLRLLGGIVGTVGGPHGLADAQVSIQDEDGQEVWSDTLGPDGAWTADGLLPGTYRVRVSGRWLDAGGPRPYIPEWWVDGNSFATAAPVVVPEGGHAPGLVVTLTDELQAYTPPAVTGSAVVGKRLEASPGRWNLTAGAERTYTWLRGDTAVGTGPTYRPTQADVGASLRVRVDASVGDLSGSALSAPTAPVAAPPAVKRATSTQVKATYQRARRAVRLRIAVVGPSTPTGAVRVTRGGRTVAARVKLTRGRAAVTIKRVKPGKHIYVVTYAGSPTLLASTGRATVRVPQPRR